MHQLGEGTPDGLLREDPTLQKTSSLKNLAQALNGYVRAPDVLDRNLGRELSATLLQQRLCPKRELEALNGGFELLCEACSTQNGEVEENAEASAYPCLGVEDEECEAALREHLRTQGGRQCGPGAYQRVYEQTAGTSNS